MTWVGLGLMGVQFGILARLTWWEYSWDIMEPVTYFVTYGTAMAAYAYYCLTKQVNTVDDLNFQNFIFIYFSGIQSSRRERSSISNYHVQKSQKERIRRGTIQSTAPSIGRSRTRFASFARSVVRSLRAHHAAIIVPVALQRSDWTGVGRTKP